MNIRCSFCQVPYAISRVTMLDALQEMDAHKLTHYDAQCPRCRRATPIPRQKLEIFMPNWRDELKKFEAEMKEHPQHEAPLPKPEPDAAAVAESKPVQVPAKEKPAAEKPLNKKPALQPKATEKKSTAGKATSKKSK